MAFRTYQQGLKIATDTANQAISKESSLSTLSPLASPIPTLQQTFPLYISSAEVYSHLLSSDLVPLSERETIRKRWRLVLGRAEKVKQRIESLGGKVGKVDIGDEGLEAAVKRRSGVINGLQLPEWTAEPSPREFQCSSKSDGQKYREDVQPEMPDVDVEWTEIEDKEWECVMVPRERWTVRQGTGADCSVSAGLGVCIEHNRTWRTTLGSSSLYPHDRRSENGKHILKLLLNGAWRSVIIDALLPRSKITHQPLHAIAIPLPSTSTSSSSSSNTQIGPPWVPLATKAYFKALGGYTIRGSDPGPDIHAFTGWIPERMNLKDGFQREKEWKRTHRAWNKGQVLVTLGTGKEVNGDLVAFHAYAVIGVREDESWDRVLEVVDPGSTPRQSDGVLEESMAQLSLAPQQGSIMMTWDQVCSDFETLSLNWDPALFPNTATRHWTWPKPPSEDDNQGESSPRYRLNVRGDQPGEVCILLSQHTTSKDRPLDDIALHVFEEQHAGSGSGSSSRSRVLHPHRVDSSSPYSNGLHVLARYTPRQANTDIIIIPSRDRGLFQRDFTLQTLAPGGMSITLDRIKASLPFSTIHKGQLSSRNSGGHPGNPSHMVNPQYKVVVGSDTASTRPRAQGSTTGRQIWMSINGDREVPWNIKLVWGNGARVFDLTEDAVIADSGAYSYGMAYCDVLDIQPGTYTAIVSTFDPGVTSSYTLNLESALPISIEPIPAEGAGLYSRIVQSKWIGENAGGRPSGGSYLLNPKIELILPKPGSISARLYLPNPLPHPINLTIFKRLQDGALGEQVSTTGPYIDQLPGVAIVKTKLDAGIYLCIPSTYERGMEGAWTLNVWSDVSLSADLL